MQDLVRKELLRSRRSPGGGFRLARRLDVITLRDVVAAIDGLDPFYACVTGPPGCSDETPCPLHDMWKEMRAGLMESFEKTNLETMARAIARKKKTLASGKRRPRN